MDVTLSFSRDEAIILSHWLYRFNATERPDLFEDQAEQRMIWDLEAQLEKWNPIIFSPEYQAILERARDAIRDDEINDQPQQPPTPSR